MDLDLPASLSCENHERRRGLKLADSMTYGGCEVGATPQLSSILVWEFPWNKPSSYWDTPMIMEISKCWKNATQTARVWFAHRLTGQQRALMAFMMVCTTCYGRERLAFSIKHLCPSQAELSCSRIAPRTKMTCATWHHPTGAACRTTLRVSRFCRGAQGWFSIAERRLLESDSCSFFFCIVTTEVQTLTYPFNGEGKRRWIKATVAWKRCLACLYHLQSIKKHGRLPQGVSCSFCFSSIPMNHFVVALTGTKKFAKFTKFFPSTQQRSR